MESVRAFSLSEMMQRILQHPTATFSAMGEGTEKIHVQMPVASVERFRGTLETVKRELEQTDPQTNIVIFCPTEAEIVRLTEVLVADDSRNLGERLTFIKGNLSGGFELFAPQAKVGNRPPGGCVRYSTPETRNTFTTPESAIADVAVRRSATSLNSQMNLAHIIEESTAELFNLPVDI